MRFEVKDLLDKQKCEEIIQKYSLQRWVKFEHKFESQELANTLWKNLKGKMVDQEEEWKSVCVDKNFVIKKYSQSSEEEPATIKESYAIDENTKTFQTLKIFLNQNFKDGHSKYNGLSDVLPATGKGVVFINALISKEDKPSDHGTKWVLETQIGYQKNED